jgi:thiamine kinase-like enzyme
MEDWLNHRLPDVEAKLALEKYPLVLCHLDLAPRNMIRLEDGSLCLLDWKSAGLYPRFFEVCILSIAEYTHGQYELDLISWMAELTEDEEAQM